CGTRERVAFRAASKGPGAAQQDPRATRTPGILPPQSHPFGMTYGQWEGAFWKWAFSLPADHNPLTDTAPASTGQSGHVWFLGGTFAPTAGPGGAIIGRANRDAPIPARPALVSPPRH